MKHKYLIGALAMAAVIFSGCNKLEKNIEFTPMEPVPEIKTLPREKPEMYIAPEEVIPRTGQIYCV